MFIDLYQNTDLGILILRLAVAAVFIIHSLPKLKNYKNLGPMMGVSGNAVLILGLVEFFGALTLITGFFARLGALLLSGVTIAAITFKRKKWGVPFSANDKTGWKFDFILLAANIAILFS